MITKINSTEGTFKYVTGVSLLAVAFVLAVVPAFASAQTFTQTLKFGSRGTQVSTLQTYLSEDPNIYPSGLVTGYFGSLTNSGVKRFQTQNMLTSDGIVGPMTRSVLNANSSGGVNTTGDVYAPQLINAYISTNRNSVVVNWNTNELARSSVYYSTSPLTPSEMGNNVYINGNVAATDLNFKTGNSITIENLQPNMVYYYMLYSIDQSGNITVTWPSTFQTSN